MELKMMKENVKGMDAIKKGIERIGIKKERNKTIG